MRHPPRAVTNTLTALITTFKICPSGVPLGPRLPIDCSALPPRHLLRRGRSDRHRALLRPRLASSKTSLRFLAAFAGSRRSRTGLVSGTTLPVLGYDDFRRLFS